MFAFSLMLFLNQSSQIKTSSTLQISRIAHSSYTLVIPSHCLFSKMNFRFIIDQLYKKHTVLFKKALPESFYSQSIPVAEKGNMKVALSLILCLAFAFVVNSLREEDLSFLEDDILRDETDSNKRFLFKKRVSVISQQRRKNLKQIMIIQIRGLALPIQKEGKFNSSQVYILGKTTRLFWI